MPFDWTDAVAAAKEVARAAGLEFDLSPGEPTPFHPGRTASLTLNRGPRTPRSGRVRGRVAPEGDREPGVARTDVRVRGDARPGDRGVGGLLVRAVPVRTPPLAKEDFAFVVDAGLPAGELVATVREAAGRPA